MTLLRTAKLTLAALISALIAVWYGGIV